MKNKEILPDGFESTDQPYQYTHPAFNSVVTAYRHAIGSHDVDMENEIQEYAIEIAGLTPSEDKIAYNIAMDEEILTYG